MSSWRRTSSSPFEQNRWKPRILPKYIALDGMDPNELNGGTGRKIPVAASNNACIRFLFQISF